MSNYTNKKDHVNFLHDLGRSVLFPSFFTCIKSDLHVYKLFTVRFTVAFYFLGVFVRQSKQRTPYWAYSYLSVCHMFQLKSP
jgi:hypothetical protein